MQTGDGLLTRLRIVGNRLTPTQLCQIAQLALDHGNGLIEVTARGNLQVRGLTEHSAPLLAAAATALLALETSLVVDMSPLAGEDPREQTDPRPLSQAIRQGAAPFAQQLGPKVSVVIDAGGQVSLAALKADIRLLAQDAQHWAVTLGGAKTQLMDQPTAVATTLATLGALAALGPDARATDLFPATVAGRPDTAPRSSLPPSVLGGTGAEGAPALQTHTGHTAPIALPFGQIPGTALVALAQQAMAAGLTTIRLAPDHTLLFDNASPALLSQATTLGFITGPDDPRRRISACIGSEGCASGHIAARRLAQMLAPNIAAGQHLHVSGCAKGCAHPRPAEVTLVGRPDGIGLVIGGRAGDTPRDILDEAGLMPALAARQDAR